MVVHLETHTHTLSHIVTNTHTHTHSHTLSDLPHPHTVHPYVRADTESRRMLEFVLIVILSWIISPFTIHCVIETALIPAVYGHI